MKKLKFIIIALFVFLTNSVFSQVYEEVENPSMNRTEYYDFSGNLIYYSTLNTRNNILEFYDINGKLIDVKKYKRKKKHSYSNNNGRHRNKSTADRYSGEIYGNGMFYIFKNGKISGVRFFDTYRDRDEISAGP